MTYANKSVKNMQNLLHATSNVEAQQSLHTTMPADEESKKSLHFNDLSKINLESIGQIVMGENHDLQQLQHQQSNIDQLFVKSPVNVPQYILDCGKLSEAELKKKYKPEYNSWRSRRSDAQKDGIPFYAAWGKSFAAFLRHHGPKGDPSFTLHKKIPELGYVPGNTAWEGKTMQTWERPNTIKVLDNGIEIPLGVWADRNGISRDVCYRKYHDGWSLAEIKAGQKQKNIPPPLKFPANNPWPPGCENIWENNYRQRRGGCSGKYDRDDRLGFLICHSITLRRQLEGEMDAHYYPDGYELSDEEKQEYDAFNKKAEKIELFWQHARKEAKKRGWGTPQLDEYYWSKFK